ncbi:hypothetical protein Spith_1534 [Spirochaeta thermophila DSM 6578]|uniref:Uncharacterized protein n=1 Tax=Winmispira thermophila (strain ATCC 700085 / DSM 6578 / Z-1203) TaxID=869211 RepID=G0GAH7_WINT7|nr:hypothetical protein [Spirochaeta thermophila]AEJ61796.1 hypothetical protein Spith_1534 [Spirochaeta thermophila DSM 6578]
MNSKRLWVVLLIAVMATPLVAGDYKITATMDLGFGVGIPGIAKDGSSTAKLDWSIVKLDGTIDEYNSYSLTLEYNDWYDKEITSLDLKNSFNLGVSEFFLTTDLLGPFGLSGLPFSLKMVSGYGPLAVSGRYDNLTGWSTGRWSGWGVAHLYDRWNRFGVLDFRLGLMDNKIVLRYGLSPLINRVGPDGEEKRIPMLGEITFGEFSLGLVSLKGDVNFRGEGYLMAGGGRLNLTMMLGPVTLGGFLGEDYKTNTDTKEADNALFVGIKPSLYLSGLGTAYLGAWYGLATTMPAGGDTTNVHKLAVDGGLTVKATKTTIYGGVRYDDLLDTEDNGGQYERQMSYEYGVKQEFGAVAMYLGYNYTQNGQDMYAAQGTVGVFTNDEGDKVGNLYMRIKFYW